MPENRLAFELYYSGRLPGGLGPLGVAIEMSVRPELKEFTENNAYGLLEKLHVINGTVQELELEDAKQAGKGNDVGGAAASHRGRR
jgi:hypothetical protein